MQDMTIYQKFKNKSTGRVNRKIYEVIDKSATIDRSFVKEGTFHEAKNNTLFDEISLISHKKASSDDWSKLSNLRTGYKAESLNKFIDGIIDNLSEHIEKTWQPNKSNIVLHSSGWDSRVLSGILLNLYKRLGDKWLGKILFVCFGRESSEFKKIMQIEGWSEDQFTSLPINDEAFFDYQFDFRNVWHYVNGCCAFPINIHHWITDKLRNLNLISENLEKVWIWDSTYFNELYTFIPKMNGNQIEDFLKKYYYSKYAETISASPCNYVRPVLNFETLKHLIESNLSKSTLRYRFNRKVVERINPKLITPTRLDFEGYLIPQKHYERTKNNYYASWYGKRVKPEELEEPVNKVVYHPWWSRWSSASLVEHLIEKGVEVC